jgi:RimJ/RimL family protein N-acetyltransferase
VHVQSDELDRFLSAAFPADADQMRESPISQLDHTRRAALSLALMSTIPSLPREAIDAGYEWEDVCAWIAGDRGNYQIESPIRLPVRAGAQVALRTVDGADLEAFYRAALSPRMGYAWRFRGATVTLERFVSTFGDGVLAQYSVISRTDYTLQGLVTAYNYDASNGHAYFGYLRVEDASLRGALTEGIGLFLDHLFNHFTLRHAYCEVPAFNSHLTAGYETSGLLERMARFPDHLFAGGLFHDLNVYRLRREVFESRFSSWDFSS